MTVATDLIASLAGDLGPAEERIHTAIPPIGVGGGADVLEFRKSKHGGVVYVSAGASAHQRPEIALLTRAPAEWAAPLVSKVAAASLSRKLASGGSIPLGDGPVPGLLFGGLAGLRGRQIEKRWTSFLLAVGVTGGELRVCRSHGTPHVVELLRQGNVHPFTEAGRVELPAIASLGPSALDRKGLSADARDGLFAVVNGLDEDVEGLRKRFAKKDLEILVAAYADLGTLHQRYLLVHLVQDSKDATLLPLYAAYARDAVKAPKIEEQTGEHASLAIALCALDGFDFERFDDWFGDLDAALAHARELTG